MATLAAMLALPCSTLAVIAPLQSTLIQSTLAAPECPKPDLLAKLLEDKRSPDTRRAYESDLRDFAQSTLGGEPTRAMIDSFLAQPREVIALQVATYKSTLRARNLSEATINRRLAAIKSLLKFAHRLGQCETDGRNLVDGERVKSYRDTRGVDVKILRKLLAQPGKNFEKLQARPNISLSQSNGIEDDVRNIYSGENFAREKFLRDNALLRLLIENALRRAEVCKLNVSDFDPSTSSLWILGKGRGQQKERVTLSPACVAAVGAYLACFGIYEQRGAAGLDRPAAWQELPGTVPLFRNLDRRPGVRGARLTSDGLYGIVGEYGEAVGVPNLTPHKLRHSCLTLALEATGGDVRRVQKLSRHKNLSTLQIYDDAREDFQGQVSNLISNLL